MDTLKGITKDVILREEIEYKNENIPEDVKEFLDKKELMEFIYTPWNYRGEDYVKNVCGFCGERSEEPEIEEDYTNKYGQFFCVKCHKACVLCINIQDFMVNDETIEKFRIEDGLEKIEYDNTCCVKRDKDMFTCYPIVIEYKMDSEEYDKLTKEEVERVFNIVPKTEAREGCLKDIFDYKLLTEDEIIERFMNSDYCEKYKIEPIIEMDMDTDFWMFVGRCTNCKKMRAGLLWGD